MDRSNRLCEELIPTYSNFEPYSGEEFVGYKLVEKWNLNYYSIVTGLFRYKPGKIKHSSYSGLHQKNENSYNVELHNRLCVFSNKKDALESLISYKDIADYETNLVILEIKISGNLKSAKFSNISVKDIPVIIGDTIESVREINKYDGDV